MRKRHFQTRIAPPRAVFALNRTAAAVQGVLLGLTLAATGLPAYAQSTTSEEEGVSTLPATLVEGEMLLPSGLPPTYAGGQVAYGSRVGLLGNKDFMETPFSTVSYTEKYIADRQAQNITQVIAATDPSVFSNGLTGTFSENYSIRGFASDISDVTIGGLYGVAPYYRISPEMYERIEVLKGPSALLNGMPPGGSVGGSVNLVPKRAGDEPLTRLTGTYMSDAQFGGHLDVGRRFGEDQQFGIRFNGVYRDGDGAINHQEQKAELTSLGLDWRGERARLSADLYQSEDRIRGQNRGINLASGVAVPKPPKADTLLNPDWAYVQTKDRGAIVRGEYDLTDSLMAYAAYGASRTRYTYSGTMLATVFNDAGDFRTSMGQLKMELEKTSGEVGLKGHFQTAAIKHQWSLNATHYGDTQKDFGRRQQVLTDSFSVTTGARTDRYDEEATTPAAALLVKLSEHVSLYANYIEGLSQGATAPMTAANAGDVFAPYKSKQKEVGLKVDLGDFTHTLSLYEIKRPGSYLDPNSNIFSFGGEQRNRGVEWGFFGSPLDNVRLMGGVAHVDPKITKTEGGVNQGKTATGLPKLQGKLGVEWDTPVLDGLTLTANATSVSKQYISDDNTQSIPGYTIFDLGTRYATRVASRPVTLRASVTNLTDKAYWGTPLLSSLGLGAPRTFELSASVDF